MLNVPAYSTRCPKTCLFYLTFGDAKSTPRLFDDSQSRLNHSEIRRWPSAVDVVRCLFDNDRVQFLGCTNHDTENSVR